MGPGRPSSLIPVRDAAFEALVAVGAAAVEPLCRRALQADAQLGLKDLAGEALRRIGSPAAVAPITDHVLRWKEIANDQELLVWMNVLNGIGGNEAERALQRIQRHVEELTREPTDEEIAAAELDTVRLPEAEAAPGEVDPRDGIYALVLVKALEGAKPLTIHLDRKGGAFRYAFATAERFNKMPHDVDVSGLKFEGDTLRGPVRVTVNPDNWNPRDGKPVSCRYTLEATVSGADIRGTFKGVYGAAAASGGLWGLLQNRPRLPDPAWFHLRLEDALDGIDGPSYHHRAHASFTLMAGAAYDGQITEYRQRVPISHSVGWEGSVESIEATITDGALSATVNTIIRSARGPSISWGPHAFVLDGHLIGKVAAGRHKTLIEGTHVKSRGFIGTVEAAPEPDMTLADCQGGLVLEGALDGGEPLSIPLDREGGVFKPLLILVRDSLAALDLSDLRVEHRIINGKARLAFRSPKDGRRLTCVYTIEADARHSRVTGRFKGMYREMAVSGTVWGSVRPRRE
jgi:hypothetical protein